MRNLLGYLFFFGYSFGKSLFIRALKNFNGCLITAAFDHQCFGQVWAIYPIAHAKKQSKVPKTGYTRLNRLTIIFEHLSYPLT